MTIGDNDNKISSNNNNLHQKELIIDTECLNHLVNKDLQTYTCLG